MPTDDLDEVLELIAKRIDILEFLNGDRVPKRIIADELGYSRSTVNRAITALADAGLVDDAPSGCQTTFIGSVLADQYDEYVSSVRTVLESREVLAPLPLDADFPLTVLADSEVTVPEGPNPYGPYNAFEGVLDRAVGEVRVYAPTFSNPRGIELARNLSTQMNVEIVFDSKLIEELYSDMPNEVETLFDLEKFTGYETTNGPAYSLTVVTTESGTEGIIVIYSSEQELVGCIVTSNPEATRWMEGRYSAIKTESERLDTIP